MLTCETNINLNTKNKIIFEGYDINGQYNNIMYCTLTNYKDDVLINYVSIAYDKPLYISDNKLISINKINSSLFNYEYLLYSFRNNKFYSAASTSTAYEQYIKNNIERLNRTSSAMQGPKYFNLYLEHENKTLYIDNELKLNETETEYNYILDYLKLLTCNDFENCMKIIIKKCIYEIVFDAGPLGVSYEFIINKILLSVYNLFSKYK